MKQNVWLENLPEHVYLQQRNLVLQRTKRRKEKKGTFEKAKTL